MILKLPYCSLILVSLLTGCIERHRFTSDLGNHLYAEMFDYNPAGTGTEYLTDSTNFRVYVGQFDSDHENFAFKITGDTIRITKLTTAYSGDKQVIGELELSRKYLTKNKGDSVEPLFEFK